MAKRPAKKKVSSLLLDALNFISLATHKEGEPYKTHCVLRQGWAYSFDGVLACGHKTDDTLEAQPHTETLLKALSKCGDTFSVTHVDNTLKIKGERLSVTVPCEPSPLIAVHPDMPTVGVGASLVASFALVAGLPEEGEERTACRSLLLQSGSVVGCRRGHVIIEAWHGLELGDAKLCVPIRAIKAVLDSKKELQSIGISSNSVTFHFEDCWIRTQLDEGRWPDYGRMLNLSPDYAPLPAGLFDGLQTIKDFSQDKRARFKNGSISTHNDSSVGASIECDEISGNATFSIQYLEFAKGLIEQADFYHERGCFFIGEKDGIKVRGAIAKMAGE
jgi:hypothetical protein